MSFWTQEMRYGLLHQADRNASDFRRDVLIVYVHGIFGDPLETWGDTPEWVAKKANSNVDALSFSYPACLWDKTSIERAAEDLEVCLTTGFSQYKFLIFITHSTGGLVVKRMLNNAFNKILEAIEEEAFSYSAFESLWFKAHKIVNVAVPHFGGDPALTSFGRRLYNLTFPVASPFLKLIRLTTQGAADLGRNEIIDSLRFNSSELIELHEEFGMAQNSSKERKLPYPQSREISANSDVAVPTESVSDQHHAFRGNHDSVKVPRSPSDPILEVIAQQVRDCCGKNYPLLLNSKGILFKLDALNRQLGEGRLIGTKEELERHPNGHKGSQQAISHKILESLKDEQKPSNQIVLTGAAGVGKSTAMRSIIWHLAFEYLMKPGPNQPVPFEIPLQLFSFDSDKAAFSWNELWSWHEAWVTRMFPGDGFKSTEIVRYFETQAACIIFDGLDEFLTTHPDLGISPVLQAFRHAQKSYQQNPRFSMLIVCRNSLPGLERFARSRNDVFEISRLSVEQAQNQFPQSKSWLSFVKDKGLLDIVLTPLILSALEQGDIDPDKLESLCGTSIIRSSIYSILNRSGLVGKTLEDGRVVEAEHLLITLMLISWSLYRNNLGEISIHQLRSETRQLVDSWKSFLEEEKLDREMESVALSFDLLSNSFFLNGLIQRTVFITISPDHIRLSHRQWYDFLLAQYFKLCLQYGHVDGFGESAFNPLIYKMVGELMEDEVITERMIDCVIGRWRKTGLSFIPGNVFAFISWTQTAIEPIALKRLLEPLADYSEISRIVLLTGFGFRVLKNDPKDPSVEDLRREIIPLYSMMSDCETCPIGDRIASSIAWCYMEEFNRRFGVERMRVDWPDIRFNAEGQRRALSAMCNVSGERLELDKHTRSLQVAFLLAINQTAEDTDLLIRSIHYLYFLVIAKRFGAHVLELNEGLDLLLQKGSHFEKAVYSEDSSPNLKLLYEHFKETYKESASFNDIIDI